MTTNENITTTPEDRPDTPAAADTPAASEQAPLADERSASEGTGDGVERSLSAAPAETPAADDPGRPPDSSTAEERSPSSGATDAFASTIEAPVAPPPPEAEDEEDEEEEEEEVVERPGDNVGNRLASAVRDDIGNRPGMAGDRPRSGAAPVSADAAGKKRRKRRKKKGADGDVEAQAPAADELEATGTHEAMGDAAPRGERRKRPGPPRERPAFSIGEEVFGKVSKVSEHAVWIDIAGKATGLFDRRALIENDAPAEGDQFIATVASTGVRGGMLMLAREPLDLEQARQAAEVASTSGAVVEGFVTGAIKGGLEVDIGGLRAFAPASHVDLRHGADLNYLVGQRLDFHVAQYAKKGRDIVVSRKKMLEEDARRARTEALAQIQPDTIHKGVVRKVVPYGVFVALTDAGGVEGLVHMSEASHDRGARLEETFKPGEEIEVKVLRVDDKGKLWLSRKAAIADPWDAVKEKYAVGSRHKGKVARLQPFGAFIELEPGIDGLCHTADLSLKPIQHPNDVVKVGDEIDVVVASCESGSRRIALHPAPPPEEADEPRQKVAPHRTVKAVVAQVIEGGLIVRILGVTGRSSRAFIPAGHTATQRGTDLRKEFPIGTRLEAKVIDLDPRRGEAKLSIRALKEDAEKQAYQLYRAGVAREAKFGTFADLMKKS